MTAKPWLYWTRLRTSTSNPNLGAFDWCSANACWIFISSGSSCGRAAPPTSCPGAFVERSAARRRAEKDGDDGERWGSVPAGGAKADAAPARRAREARGGAGSFILDDDGGGVGSLRLLCVGVAFGVGCCLGVGRR